MARRSGGVAAVAISLALAALAGCGEGEGGDTVATSRAGDRPSAAAPETVAPSRCPAGLSGCRTAEGRIVFVERVDPDGDGDAHFVIADPQSISARGLTAIDVRKGLRPDPLPGIGDLISVAGQVQTGSYGQSQIHAVELHVAGR